MRYSYIYFALLVIRLTSAQVGLAGADGNKTDNNNQGPEQVVIHSTVDTETVAKPAYLPHRAHQWLECSACHHGKSADGKKIEFGTTIQIEKCERCHNSKADMQERLATLKLASHSLCLSCHMTQDKELAKCGVCHPKK